jgi:hypothetical protein
MHPSLAGILTLSRLRCRHVVTSQLRVALRFVNIGKMNFTYMSTSKRNISNYYGSISVAGKGVLLPTLSLLSSVDRSVISLI